MSGFSQFNLSSWIIRQLDLIGIKEPSPIQKQCIPEILSGKDCIGAAKTGSGKTLAFALPILEKLSEDPYGIFALILTPTRELAFQIRDTFAAVGKTINLRLCVVVGGIEMILQSQELSRRPHIVVATPGRLYDHLNTHSSLSLKKIKFLVLDEADRLLSGSFDDQIKVIFSALPKNRQNLFFSATITDALEKIGEHAKRDVFQWEQKAEVATVEKLEQFYVLCPAYVKNGYLVETMRTYLEKHDGASMIVFTDTCKNCQLLSMMLNEVGFPNVALHGMISQKSRLMSLSKFKSNQTKILIATDVASRGLDIPEVNLVINHNIPSVPKDYIHRVGRTARAGRTGSAITLLSPSELPLLAEIEKAINIKLQEYTVDSKIVGKIFTQVSVTIRESEVKLDQKDFYERKAIYKRKNKALEGKDIDEEFKDVELVSSRKKKKIAPKKKKPTPSGSN